MLAENFKIVPCGIDVDINGAADNVADSINMKNFHKCTFIVQYVDMGTADHIVKVQSGATDGALTSDVTFKYAFGGAAQGSANCDVLTAWGSSAALTVAHGTYDNFLLIIEVDAAAMDIANGEEWLTLNFTDPGNATGQAIVIAVLEPRYSGNRSVSALV
jgi:hypothetical protein